MQEFVVRLLRRACAMPLKLRGPGCPAEAGCPFLKHAWLCRLARCQNPQAIRIRPVRAIAASARSFAAFARICSADGRNIVRVVPKRCPVRCRRRQVAIRVSTGRVILGRVFLPWSEAARNAHINLCARCLVVQPHIDAAIKLRIAIRLPRHIEIQRILQR